MTVRDATLRDASPGASVLDRPASALEAPTVRRSRVPRTATRPTHWRRILLAFAALGAAFASLHVVLREPFLWWLPGMAFAAGVLLAISVTRYFVRAWWIPPLVGSAVALVALTATFASDRAFLGLLPTFDSLGRLNTVISSGWISIQEQRVPAQPDPGIVLLLAITMICCVLFADAVLVLVRAPALLAAPLLTLLGIPVSVRPDIADPVWFVVTAVLFLAILRVGRRASPLPVLAVTGAVAIVGGLLTPTFLPQVEEASGSLVGGVSTGINPLINLGDDLRRGDPVIAVTYQTTAEEPVYLRLATLENFTGRSWTPNIVEDDPRNTVDDFPAPPGVGPEVGRIEETASVQVGEIAGRWLPLPYPSESVEGVEGEWLWERSGLTARGQDTGVGGQQYEVEFLDLEPTLEQVMVSRPNTDPREGDITLQLPDRVPRNIGEAAQAVAGDLTTSYDIAIALQSYFTSGEFEYSEDAPVQQGYDGSGVDIVGRFLQEKSGYCVHYASAMAIMARILGVPARVAVGFQPGEQVSAQGITSYTVSSHDLHAWPELYFEGVGWLRFEPTPGRGEVPDYDDEPVVDDPTTPEDEGATPRPTTSAGPGAVPERPDQAGVDPDLPSGGTSGASPLPIVLGSLLAVLLLGAFTPAAWRVLVRRRRERAIRSGPDPAPAAWAELRDTARDHGWAAPDSETPRDFADRLAVVLSEQRDAIAGFRSDVEVSAFAPPGRGAPTVEELRAIRAAIARTVDARDRLRAVLLPASLLARFRWDPDG